MISIYLQLRGTYHHNLNSHCSKKDNPSTTSSQQLTDVIVIITTAVSLGLGIGIESDTQTVTAYKGKASIMVVDNSCVPSVDYNIQASVRDDTHLFIPK